jgi:hypothetical protein
MNPDNSQAALAQLQQIQSTSQDPNTILSGQRQQLGVDAAQGTVTGLRGAINNTTKLLKAVAPSVMGRTGSSLVTNAQATKQIGNEQAPISQTLSEQGGQLTDASRDLGDLQDKAREAASGIYAGQQDKLSYAQNLYNTLYQKERDVEAQRRAEADRQEQIRQFNETLAQQRAEAAASSASANRSFDLGVTPPSTQKAAGATLNKDQAYSDVKGLLASKNKDWILKNVSGITKSAANGNALDKYKLQLIKSMPDFQKYTIANYADLKF